jgi:hypothetical protein
VSVEPGNGLERKKDGLDNPLTSYDPAVSCFFSPAWAAFDVEGSLLAGSSKEAESFVAEMQRYMETLQTASSLAPWITADEAYQKKYNGMLGQLVNQGRALAYYKTNEIITAIQRRSEINALNRGSAQPPYFDDQALRMKTYYFEIIPTGRSSSSRHVAWVARDEQEKIAQDNRFSPSTRKYLIAELKKLELAFEVPGCPRYLRRAAQRKGIIQTRIEALRLSFNSLTTIPLKKHR